MSSVALGTRPRAAGGGGGGGGSSATHAQRQADLTRRANRMAEEVAAADTWSNGQYITIETLPRRYKPETLLNIAMTTVVDRLGRLDQLFRSTATRRGTQLPQTLIDEIMPKLATFVKRRQERHQYGAELDTDVVDAAFFRAALPLLRADVTSLRYAVPVPVRYMQEFFQRHNNLRALSTRAGERRDLPEKIGSLRVLEIVSASLDDQTLFAIAKECRLLEQLTVDDSDMLTCSRRAALPLRFPHLRALTVRNCARITDDGLGHLTRNTPKLRSVVLFNLPSIGVVGLSVLLGTHSAQHNGGRLEVIDVQKCATTMAESAWVDILRLLSKQNAKHLQELTLVHEARYRPSMVATLLKRAPRMKKLTLSSTTMNRYAGGKVLNKPNCSHIEWTTTQTRYRYGYGRW